MFLPSFFWFAFESFGFAVMAWPVTLVLIALVVASSVRWPPSTPRLRPRDYAVLASPLVFVAITLAIGVAFPAPSLRSGRAHVTTPQEIALELCELAQVALSTAVILHRRGVRLHVASIISVEIWLSLGAQLMAGMSVTGDWL